MSSFFLFSNPTDRPIKNPAISRPENMWIQDCRNTEWITTYENCRLLKKIVRIIYDTLLEDFVRFNYRKNITRPYVCRTNSPGQSYAKTTHKKF